MNVPDRTGDAQPFGEYTFRDVEWLLHRVWRQCPNLTERKCRLFACACARACWHLLTPGLRNVVETVECFADGTATRDDLESCHRDVQAMEQWRPSDDPFARWAAFSLVSVAVSLPEDPSQGWKVVSALQEAGLTNPNNIVLWLRDIVRNPLQSGKLKERKQPRKTATIDQLAQTIYEERTFDRLPILADALEEAGCTDRAILDHCRGPGPHVRGCWVVDLILGKS